MQLLLYCIKTFHFIAATRNFNHFSAFKSALIMGTFCKKRSKNMGEGAIRSIAKVAVLTSYQSNVARRTPNLSNSSFVSSTVYMVHGRETSPLVLSNKIEGRAVQTPAFELDSDSEEVSGLSLDQVMYPPSRLIFRPTLILEEAKETTKDLKEAINGVHFNNLEYSKSGSQISDMGSKTLVASMPKHVV